MIDRLRSSAELWRSLASVALALEVLGVVVAVIVAIRTDASNAGWIIAIGAVVILFTALGYGLLFLVSNLAEGLADVIRNTTPEGARAVASTSSGQATTPLAGTRAAVVAVQEALVAAAGPVAVEPVQVALGIVAPGDAAEIVESSIKARPDAPVLLDLTHCAHGYETVIRSLLDLVAGVGAPGANREVRVLNPPRKVRHAVTLLCAEEGWQLRDLGGLLVVFLGSRPPVGDDPYEPHR